MFYASIFSNGSGAFRETGALRFFFIPKGALIHHLAIGQAVVSLPSVGPCALRGGLRSLRRAPANAVETAVLVIIVCAEWISAPIHSACENLHPTVLSQSQAIPKVWPAFSFAKEKQKKTARSEINQIAPIHKKYDEIVAKIREKQKEKRALQVKQKETPLYRPMEHIKLNSQIAEATEELEELKSEKTHLIYSYFAA